MEQSKRELVEQLLELPTRIQLGNLVQINGIQLFQVVYELDNTTAKKPTASNESSRRSCTSNRRLGRIP